MEACFECGRNYIGYDVSKEYMKINEQVKSRLINTPLCPDTEKTTIELYLKDSRECGLPDFSIDLVFTSPPYWDIEFYGDEAEQLGNANTYKSFLHELEIILAQAYRVLKSEKFCIINVNDFRKDGNFYAYHADVITLALHVGFEVHDIVIMQYPSSVRLSFPIQLYNAKETAKVHEYLLIFKKPTKYYNYMPEILTTTISARQETRNEPDNLGDLKLASKPTVERGELDEKNWKAPADRQSNLFDGLHELKKSTRTPLHSNGQIIFDIEAQAENFKINEGVWLVQCEVCGLNKTYPSEDDASLIRLLHKNGNHSKS